MSKPKLDLDIHEDLKPFVLKCLTLNHELNNPLAGIIGYCEFLIEEAGNLTDDQIQYLQRIETCAERIQDSLKKLSEEKMKLDEKINLKDTISGLAASTDS